MHIVSPYRLQSVSRYYMQELQGSQQAVKSSGQNEPICNNQQRANSRNFRQQEQSVTNTKAEDTYNSTLILIKLQTAHKKT